MTRHRDVGPSSQKRARKEDTPDEEGEEEEVVVDPRITYVKNLWKAPSWRPHELVCFAANHVSHRPHMDVVSF